jgi:hypothetical protein
VENRTQVELPDHIRPPFEVFVNGVPQKEGDDYELVGSVIVFNRSFAKEGKLGFWRWLSMFAGVAGTYRKNDSIDIAYSLNGRQLVSSVQPVAHEQA